MNIAEQFRNQVGVKFQLYNSLFTSLPFHRIEKTNTHLMMFTDDCEEGYEKGLNPQQIVDDFFSRTPSVSTDKEKIDTLFRFIQYVDRQVVLFDALEDAAFREIHDVTGEGTLHEMEQRIKRTNHRTEYAGALKTFAVSLVLTAHPTQFYPGPVLGIIHDLARALKENDVRLINTYLQQLGKTPLLKKEKPTPYLEAMSLVWYLENVFYTAAGKLLTQLKNTVPELDLLVNPVIKMGFWPGGDRDGNPNVKAETTLKVADALRSSIIKCYYLDVRKIKRRITFKNADVILADLESKLYNNIFIPGNRTDLTREDILESLNSIREIIVHEHNGLFLHLLDNLIYKVQAFGLHFASLDLRQESSVHGTVFSELEKQGLLPEGYSAASEVEQITILGKLNGRVSAESFEGIIRDTIESFETVATIQQLNGRSGCNRYIISQCKSAVNVMEVFGLFLLTGYEPGNLHVDIVPLFETIDDLRRAPEIMKQLYENPVYNQHLLRRKKIQTIMLGFSDGTKDGGYLMANWRIYKAKETLSALSKSYGIETIFFDGRGGPPARGGGKTHKFYASIGKNISTKEIHLTVQGQTISSNFGTVDAAVYNMEQLLNAGISNEMFSKAENILNAEQEAILNEMAETSLQAYNRLKEQDIFIPYLLQLTPLLYFSDTNISSRPSKRGSSQQFSLKDLRAIPFVSAWSQIKQNVPGFYGIGTALQLMDEKGKLGEIRYLYKHSAYFKTLLDNCEMAMRKTFFPLTAYLSDHPEFGPMWNDIREEYARTEKFLSMISGHAELMADYPVDRISIRMREKIVLPLTTIQQYALIQLRDPALSPEKKSLMERLVVRSSFGIINAARNSA